MSCFCDNDGPVRWQRQTKYTTGKCTPTELWLWPNPEVTPICVTANNVTVQLTPEAVSLISAEYDGTPLRVTFNKGCCTCALCCCCCCDSFCAGPCERCNCCCQATRLVVLSEFDQIWFCNQPETPLVSGVGACLLEMFCAPCVRCVNCCTEKHVSIPYAMVSVPDPKLTEMGLTTDSAVIAQPLPQQQQRQPLMTPQQQTAPPMHQSSQQYQVHQMHQLQQQQQQQMLVLQQEQLQLQQQLRQQQQRDNRGSLDERPLLSNQYYQ